jgi:hypothetical protein
MALSLPQITERRIAERMVNEVENIWKEAVTALTPNFPGGRPIRTPGFIGEIRTVHFKNTGLKRNRHANQHTTRKAMGPPQGVYTQGSR